MTQFTHEKVLFTHKLWPTPLPTNIVTPNWLYTSLPAQCTYMHTVCFVCCFYLLFQLHIIYYPALGLQWHKNYGYLDQLKPSRWHILLYKNYWHTHHHPTTYKQTGLITIQCTRASAQCKNYWQQCSMSDLLVDEVPQHVFGDVGQLQYRTLVGPQSLHRHLRRLHYVVQRLQVQLPLNCTDTDQWCKQNQFLNTKTKTKTKMKN